MAHSFDTKAQITGTSSPVAANYTCGAGSSVLVLTIVTAGTTARAGGAPTYNGVAMKSAVPLQDTVETLCELFFMIAPPTGSAYSISIPNTGSKTILACASTYKSATGYSALDVSAGAVNATGGANPSLALTPTVNGDVIVAVCGDGYIDPPTNRTHTTLYETDNGSYSDNHQYALIANTAETTIGWTISSDDYCIIAVAFKESANPNVFVNPVADTHIRSNSADTNYGADTTIHASPYVSSIRKSLLKFDVSAIPAGSTITSAILRLYATAPTTERTITASRLLRTDWVEAEATYNSYKSGSSWATAGAGNSSSDYTATGAAISASLAAAGWQAWTVTAQVQTAVSSVSGIVHLLLTDEGASYAGYNTYASRESAEAAFYPTLYVEYSAGSSFVPTCIFL